MDIFIDTYYENASPLKWEQNENGIIELELIHDHARFSPNQQITHWNFKIEVPAENVGKTVKVRIHSINCCWNRNVVPAFNYPNMATVVSYDGVNWENIQCADVEIPGFIRELHIPLKSQVKQVARLVPYTDSDLQKTISEIKDHKSVKVYNMGSTVEGRPLEMIQVGNPDAPNQILLRGRAHPWETGGNWLIEGILEKLVKNKSTLADDILNELCFHIMPMACLCRWPAKMEFTVA
ncbi:MAG: hypothetical protein GY750_13905 [Lentisphaerae bacterium]|nr:hypothetical protein [Lentisphaerota bacterium]MCP4102495.1 hypothetical protein [Lentisphaerota bacterium]